MSVSAEALNARAVPLEQSLGMLRDKLVEVETAVNGIRVRSDEKGEKLDEELLALMNKLKDADDKTENATGAKPGS